MVQGSPFHFNLPTSRWQRNASVLRTSKLVGGFHGYSHEVHGALMVSPSVGATTSTSIASSHRATVGSIEMHYLLGL